MTQYTVLNQKRFKFILISHALIVLFHFPAYLSFYGLLTLPQFAIGLVGLSLVNSIVLYFSSRHYIPRLNLYNKVNFYKCLVIVTLSISFIGDLLSFIVSIEMAATVAYIISSLIGYKALHYFYETEPWVSIDLKDKKTENMSSREIVKESEEWVENN